jgi:hypothetical protein
MEPCRLVGSIDDNTHTKKPSKLAHEAPGFGECPRHSTKRGARSTKGVERGIGDIPANAGTHDHRLSR